MRRSLLVTVYTLMATVSIARAEPILTIYGLVPIPTQSTWLYRVDPDSGLSDPIGPTGASLFGIAFAPDRNALYGVGDTLPSFENSLFRIDPQTGDAVPIGPSGVKGLFSTAYDGTTDTLYAVSETGSLYTMNLDTGAATLVADLSPGLGQAIPRALTFDSATNTMYMGLEGCLVSTLSDPCQVDGNGLAVLNLTTGSWILRGTYKGPSGDPSSFNNVLGIAYDDVDARLIGEEFSVGFIDINPRDSPH